MSYKIKQFCPRVKTCITTFPDIEICNAVIMALRIRRNGHSGLKQSADLKFCLKKRAGISFDE
jgi:hypothetical protein